MSQRSSQVSQHSSPYTISTVGATGIASHAGLIRPIRAAESCGLTSARTPWRTPTAVNIGPTSAWRAPNP